MKKRYILYALISFTALAESWQSLETQLKDRFACILKEENPQIDLYYENEYKRLMRPSFLQMNADQLCQDLKIVVRTMALSLIKEERVIEKYGMRLKAISCRGSLQTFKPIADLLEDMTEEICRLFTLNEFNEVIVLLPLIKQTIVFMNNSKNKAINVLHEFDNVVLDDTIHEEISAWLADKKIVDSLNDSTLEKIAELLYIPAFDNLFCALAPVLKDPQFPQILEKLKNGEKPGIDFSNPAYLNLGFACLSFIMSASTVQN
jgi:hypothetical protein